MHNNLKNFILASTFLLSTNVNDVFSQNNNDKNHTLYPTEENRVRHINKDVSKHTFVDLGTSRIDLDSLISDIPPEVISINFDPEYGFIRYGVDYTKHGKTKHCEALYYFNQEDIEIIEDGKVSEKKPLYKYSDRGAENEAVWNIILKNDKFLNGVYKGLNEFQSEQSEDWDGGIVTDDDSIYPDSDTTFRQTLIYEIDYKEKSITYLTPDDELFTVNLKANIFSPAYFNEKNRSYFAGPFYETVNLDSAGTQEEIKQIKFEGSVLFEMSSNKGYTAPNDKLLNLAP